MRSPGENSRHRSERITSRDAAVTSVDNDEAPTRESITSVERSLPSHDERILSERTPESDEILGGGSE